MTPVVVLAGLLAAAVPASAQVQQGADVLPVTLEGTLLDDETGRPLPDAVIRLAGTQVSAASDRNGVFVLRGLVPGEYTLEIRHPRTGIQTLPLSVRRAGERFRVEIRVAPAGVAAEILGAEAGVGADGSPGSPIPVVQDELLIAGANPTRYAGTYVERERLQQLAAGARNLGELIERAVPALRRRTDQRDDVGLPRCLEFGGTRGQSLNLQPVCQSPQLYLDGVIMGDAEAVFDIVSLDGIEWIQAIPANEAGPEFAGSLYGVILVVTSGSRNALRPQGARPTLRTNTRSTFDWSQDPDGHPFFRTFLGSAVGSAVGLYAGREIGRQCIFVEEGTRELDSSCGAAPLVGVSMGALLVPALTSAIGARYAGRTGRSQGSFKAAVFGAGLALVPGYIYSLATVGNAEASNAAGQFVLLVGTPLATTLADRLFRKLR